MPEVQGWAEPFLTVCSGWNVKLPSALPAEGTVCAFLLEYLLPSALLCAETKAVRPTLERAHRWDLEKHGADDPSDKKTMSMARTYVEQRYLAKLLAARSIVRVRDNHYAHGQTSFTEFVTESVSVQLHTQSQTTHWQARLHRHATWLHVRVTNAYADRPNLL